MTEPVTGVSAPAAGGQVGPGQPAQPAGQPAAQGQPGAGGQPVQPDHQVQVPLSVVEAVRKELSEAKASKTEIEAKLNQIQAMQQFAPAQPVQPSQPSAAQPAPEPPKDPFEGMDDEELISVKDIRKLSETFKPDVSQAIAPLKAEIAKIQLQATDPNYEQTIRTYLPEMIAANPMLRDMITRSPNPIVAALGVSRMNPRYVQAAGGGITPAPSPDPLTALQRIIENATRPGAPGSMGGGGAFSGNDRFRNMNDAEFDAEVNRVLAGGMR